MTKAPIQHRWMIIIFGISKALAIEVIRSNEGGVISEFSLHIHELARTGEPVEIRGTCASACTITMKDVRHAASALKNGD